MGLKTELVKQTRRKSGLAKKKLNFPKYRIIDGWIIVISQENRLFSSEAKCPHGKRQYIAVLMRKISIIVLLFQYYFTSKRSDKNTHQATSRIEPVVNNHCFWTTKSCSASVVQDSFFPRLINYFKIDIFFVHLFLSRIFPQSWYDLRDRKLHSSLSTTCKLSLLARKWCVKQIHIWMNSQKFGWKKMTIFLHKKHS